MQVSTRRNFAIPSLQRRHRARQTAYRLYRQRLNADLRGIVNAYLGYDLLDRAFAIARARYRRH